MKYEMKCYPGDHPRIDVTEEFINNNNLSLKKTQEEIKEKINNASGFAFGAEVLVDYLSRDNAQEYLQDEYKEKVKKGEVQYEYVVDVKEATQDFLDYMVFGWMKALDERGLSAGRTISKLSSWMWLLGRDDLSEILEDYELYSPYGMPALIKCCEELGIEVPKDCIEFAN